MPLFLNECPVGVCDRCSAKRPWRMLIPDGNTRGLRVCSDRDCWDPINPWRLAPIAPDRIALKWSRPDVPLAAGIPYRDFTNPPNPSPPDYIFYEIEGLEGTGAIGTEGGGSTIALQPTGITSLEDDESSGLESGQLGGLE